MPGSTPRPGATRCFARRPTTPSYLYTKQHLRHGRAGAPQRRTVAPRLARRRRAPLRHRPRRRRGRRAVEGPPPSGWRMGGEQSCRERPLRLGHRERRRPHPWGQRPRRALARGRAPWRCLERPGTIAPAEGARPAVGVAWHPRDHHARSVDDGACSHRRPRCAPAGRSARRVLHPGRPSPGAHPARLRRLRRRPRFRLRPLRRAHHRARGRGHARRHRHHPREALLRPHTNDAAQPGGRGACVNPLPPPFATSP